MTFPVAILAGGLATRMRPLTESIPKAMVEINREPFVAHQLRLLASKGIREVVICVSYLGELIGRFVGSGEKFGLHVQYSFDGPTLLGTAGAIKQALPLLTDSFFILYGDSYLPCNYKSVQEAFERSGTQALMTVFDNQNRWDKSNVEFLDGRILSYDKSQPTARMHHIDYGLGVVHRTTLDLVPADQPFDLADLYQTLLSAGQLAGYEVTDRFYEIGSLQGIEDLRRYLGMDFTRQFLQNAIQVIDGLDMHAIEKAVAILVDTRAKEGRLFILGVGGGAAHASHAVNDFRKLTGIEAYAPTDNVAELTARINDDGWPTVFEAWLRGSRLRPADAVLVFSVGGGDVDRNISPNLVAALRHAKETGSCIISVVGRDGGFAGKVADVCVLIPSVDKQNITPLTEALQALVWHLMVSHPRLRVAPGKWESITDQQ